MTPAKRMERLQRWNLERLPVLTEELFRRVMERADRAYEKLPGRENDSQINCSASPRPDDTG